VADSSYVSVAGYDYSERAAKAVITGYAFARTQAVAIEAAAGCPESSDKQQDFPRWGYETYDCIPAGPDASCHPVDYLIASGLNGRLDVPAVASLQFACPLAFEELSRVDPDIFFWNLDPDRLAQFPDVDCAERYLWLAWCHMMSTPELGVALTHKTLHHKRPSLFPLIDGQTVHALGEEVWRTIHQDLNQGDGEPFEQLESWFRTLVGERGGGVELTRLRLHDILLWSAILPGQRAEAAEKGALIT
jgi:hypothetical protein